MLDGKERLELLYNILHPEGGQFAFEWDWPVSYTHLDVYKRQVLDRMRENTTYVRNIKKYLLAALYNAPVTMDSYYTSLVSHDPVSYTHLDVYKRQIRHGGFRRSHGLLRRGARRLPGDGQR